MYFTPDSPIVKHCEQCGAEFTAFQANRKYCTDCIVAKGRAVITRICDQCGHAVEVVLSTKTKANRTKPVLCYSCRHAKPQIVTALRCVECGCRFERSGKRGPKSERCPSCQKQHEKQRQLSSTCSKCGAPCQGRSRQCKRCFDEPGGHIRLPRKHCEVCGREFQPKSSANKYCGRKECRRIGRRRTTDERLGYPNWYVCRYCGEWYKAKSKDRDTCCCREHWVLWIQENPRLGPMPATWKDKACEICGEPVSSPSAKTCGATECKRARYVISAVSRSERNYKPRRCAECGDLWTPEYGDMRQNYCSDACSTKRNKRISKARRRARIRNAAVAESVDPIAVFNRDKWKCRLCGVHTPKRLRGTIDDRAPELDHIIPLSMGGDHSYANTQCLCRKCNGLKGANISGQLGLL